MNPMQSPNTGVGRKLCSTSNKGQRVNHPQYGSGTIIEDEENLCEEGEVLVKFDKAWDSGGINNHKYAHLVLGDTEIVYQKDLTNE